MKAKNKNIILFCLVIKILFHSLSQSLHLKLSSSPKTLILSQSLSSLKLFHSPSSAWPSYPKPLSKLTVTLLSHRHSLKLPHSPPSARPSRPKPLIALDPRRSPLCLTGGGGGCMGRLVSVGGWVYRHWWAVVWLNSCWVMVGRSASVGFIGIGGLWCGWYAMVARVGFVVVVE